MPVYMSMEAENKNILIKLLVLDKTGNFNLQESFELLADKVNFSVEKPNPIVYVISVFLIMSLSLSLKVYSKNLSL